jgi:hypothetical protein
MAFIYKIRQHKKQVSEGGKKEKFRLAAKQIPRKNLCNSPTGCPVV